MILLPKSGKQPRDSKSVPSKMVLPHRSLLSEIQSNAYFSMPSSSVFFQVIAISLLSMNLQSSRKGGSCRLIILDGYTYPGNQSGPVRLKNKLGQESWGRMKYKDEEIT